MTRGKTNRKRRNRIIAVAVLLALLLAACGNENGDDTKDTDTQGMTEPEKKTEERPEGQTLDNGSSAAGADAEESKGTPISDLTLNVDEILEDSFMAKEVLTEDQGDAGEIAVLDPEEATQLKIIFTDQTTFTVRTSTDMGATYTDTQGTSADLEVGSSVEVSGTKDGDTVYASTVMIMKFS